MYMPTGPVRGRFTETSPRNFDVSPTIQRVQRLGRNVNHSNTPETYKRLSEQYISQLGAERRVSDDLISGIGKNRKSVFQNNAQAAILSPRPMKSLNRYKGNGQSEYNKRREDAISSHDGVAKQTHGNSKMMEDAIDRKLAQYETAKSESKSSTEEKKSDIQYQLAGPSSQSANDTNRFSYLLENKNSGYVPYADPPWGTLDTKDHEDVKKREREINKKIKKYYDNEKTFDSTGIVHQYHERSQPPKRDSPLKLGLLEKLQGAPVQPKRRGLRVFEQSYKSEGVKHKVHERSETPTEHRRHANHVTENANGRISTDKSVSKSDNNSVEIIGNGTSLLEQLPSASKAYQYASRPNGVRVYPKEYVKNSFESQRYLSPRQQRSLPEKPGIVNFENIANKETSKLAQQSNVAGTSKVSRFVLNQEPDFRASFRKYFEEANQQKDVLNEQIFSPRRSLPLPKSHPMMLINTSRKRQFAGKHNSERTGSDYSSINDKLHVMGEPVNADSYSIKVVDGGGTARQENSDNSGSSTSRSLHLSMPKSLGRKRPSEQKQSLLATKDWSIPQYPDPGNQLENRKLYNLKRSSGLRARDFVSGGKDVLLNNDGATGVAIVDEFNANHTKIGAYSPESVHGVKATYAKSSKAYARSERTWDSMVGHSRHSSNGNFTF